LEREVLSTYQNKINFSFSRSDFTFWTYKNYFKYFSPYRVLSFRQTLISFSGLKIIVYNTFTLLYTFFYTFYSLLQYKLSFDNEPECCSAAVAFLFWEVLNFYLHLENGYHEYHFLQLYHVLQCKF